MIKAPTTGTEVLMRQAEVANRVQAMQRQMAEAILLPTLKLMNRRCICCGAPAGLVQHD